ncbi:uncharacterized protein BO95DRAFT_446558 [Aspergillus brunneoviolaceus CBS 621.78]|uniref:Uncharacterized protein n=1 Tax=Aspergillus brunneoviolaceus CBS 621.78 TaxID=1450534 RepID=A0ACD1FY77_9EURO|nr:hypothetical protein BO95DRAFT_446558 [Aspergillus brunneoviolaceus CBS 621.78]RAH41945.1 hypothetical protein BO95DRAFT_446558 [Aspergillus brunneoviolaceus CBS 621.78]
MPPNHRSTHNPASTVPPQPQYSYFKALTRCRPRANSVYKQRGIIPGIPDCHSERDSI